VDTSLQPSIWETTEIARIEALTSKLIPISEACRISGLTPSFIARLLRRGDIEGVKVGRDWLTTEEAIRKYLKQERRPGPKPRKK
jgi:excisionase family DNA binding protein